MHGPERPSPSRAPSTTQGTEADQAREASDTTPKTRSTDNSRGKPGTHANRHATRTGVPTLHTRRSAVERQAGKQGLVGVEVVVADTSARIAAAMAAVPDAVRRYCRSRRAHVWQASEAVARKLACDEATEAAAERSDQEGPRLLSAAGAHALPAARTRGGGTV